MNKTPFITPNTLRKFLLLIALVLLAWNVGYRMGQKGIIVGFSQAKQVVVNTSPPPSREVDFALFWEVWNRLEQKYIDKTKLDSQKMVYGAIYGMVQALGDPYTVFLPPKENEDFKSDLSGAFEGIGAQLGAKDDKIVVIAPLKEHPAEKAGILAGDWIIKVNNEETYGWTVPQAVNKIRGPKGSQVVLTVIHDGHDKPEDIKVTRDTITIKSVEVEFKTAESCETNCPEIALIKLARFGDSTNDEWSQAVSQIRAKSDIRGIILDMRNNPGGYFQSSINIASEFLKSGVVVQQENSDGTRETFSVTRVGSLLTQPLVVLINKGSASASEIVAGALKDHKRATLIGETSFGKGSIQSPEDLSDGSGLHITTARWILPNGDWIHSKGITPDIEIKSDVATDSAAKVDPQLERAIEEVLK